MGASPASVNTRSSVGSVKGKVDILYMYTEVT